MSELTARLQAGVIEHDFGDFDIAGAELAMKEAAYEIERLGRCNDELSRSHTEVVNHQKAEIERLQEYERIITTLRALAGKYVDMEYPE